MHFDFVDLKLFINLAAARNLTRAAERTSMSLSAASARIKNLEDKMGVKLIHRNKQGATLTSQGETFLHHAGLIMQQSITLQGDMQEHSEGMKGHLRVFTNHNASTEFLPKVLRRFLLKNPRVSVELQEHISQDVLNAVQSGAADIGIVSTGIYPDGLEVLPYFRDDVVLVTALGHPLASRKIVAFDECRDYDFVGIPGARWVDALLSGARSDTDKPMRIRAQGGSYEAVCRMIEADIGICVMQASVAKRNAGHMKLKVIRISDNWSEASTQICARSFEQLPRFGRVLVEMMSEDFRHASTSASK
jgi:DNA-binding transcriptional LysR family regulator